MIGFSQGRDVTSEMTIYIYIATFHSSSGHILPGDVDTILGLAIV
jgi:hypothetical protein